MSIPEGDKVLVEIPVEWLEQIGRAELNRFILMEEIISKERDETIIQFAGRQKDQAYNIAKFFEHLRSLAGSDDHRDFGHLWEDHIWKRTRSEVREPVLGGIDLDPFYPVDDQA